MKMAENGVPAEEVAAVKPDPDAKDFVLTTVNLSKVKSEQKSDEKSGEEKKEKRHRSHHHHRPRRANIGIQCRRDKTVNKYVGFSGGGNGSVGGSNYGFCLANPCQSLAGRKYKYGHLMRVEISPNGLGKVLHMWQHELDALDEKQVEEAAREFIKVTLHRNNVKSKPFI